MKCPIETRENAELLLEYCARQLNPAATATLERHLEVCPECRRFAETQRAVWSALDEWETQPVSADFDRRLYARIDREVSWWQRVTRPLRPLLVRGGLPIAAAACLLIMAGVYWERPEKKSAVADRQATSSEAVPADQVEHALDDMELLREFHLKVRADSRTKM
jgi:hypothetical protein